MGTEKSKGEYGMLKSARKSKFWLLTIMLVFGALFGDRYGAGKAWAAGGDFANGTGTSADPYLIATAGQLDKVRDGYLVSGTHFKLVADIDLSGYANWVSIGDSDVAFGGHFDGNGHTISGLTSRDWAGFGLFGLLDSGSWIGNLRLTDVSIIVPDSLAGGLAGANFQGTIENVSVSGEIEAGDYVGGLVGQNYEGTILNSNASVKVTGLRNIGGLVGDQAGTISDSYATGDVNGERNVGGLIGYAEETEVRRSYATGDVVGTNEVGGLIGRIDEGIIEQSHASGNVTGNMDVGGLIGTQIEVTLSDSYATGDVYATADGTSIGGLVGYNNDGKILSSYALGSVTGQADTDNIGGLAGVNSFVEHGGEIRDSYAAGDVDGGENGFIVGGLVGLNMEDALISHSFALGDINASPIASESGMYSGGLVGTNTYGIIEDSYATGRVRGNYAIGGFIGENTNYLGGAIYRSFAVGNVEGGGIDNQIIGGFAGFNAYGNIYDSYASGEVSGGSLVGGLAGENGSGRIQKSYSRGKVTGSTDVGGLVGSGDWAAYVNSFYDIDTSGQSTSIWGTGQNTLQMQSQTTYEADVANAWDFVTVWGIDPDLNGGYPYLRSSLVELKYEDNGSTGGTAPISDTVVPVTAAIVSGELDLVKTGYTFAGWNDRADGSGAAYQTGDSLKVMKNTTLYAQWNAISLSNVATLTSTIGTVSVGGTASETITGVPYGTALVTFKAAITPAVGATFEVYEADGVTVATGLASGYKVVVTAQDGTTQVTYTITVNAPPQSTDATLTSTIGTVSVGGTASETITGVPYGTALVTFKAAITPAVGATFEVYEADGVTVATGLATGYKVIVTAQDGTTQVTYTVTVNAPPQSTDATLTSTIGTVSVGGTASETITGVPYGTALVTFKAAITPAVGATFEVYEADGVTVATGLATGYKVVVTAQDGTTQVTYTITVNAPPQSTDATLTSTIGTVSVGGTANETITGVPHGTTLAVFKAAITPATGATFEVYAADGVTVATGLVSGYKVIVTAQNGTTRVTYTVSINAVPPSTGGGGGGGPASPSNKLTLSAGKAGELSLFDEITVTVPANAADREVVITIDKMTDPRKLLANGETLLSSMFDVSKNFPENFNRPVTITIKYDSAKLPEGRIPAVFSYDELKKAWTEIEGSRTSGDRVSVQVNSFAKFAVLSVERPTEPTTETEPEKTFNDIAGHWAETAIKQAVGRRIVSGYSDGSFRPNGIITRAEFAVMLMNALNRTGAAGELTFSDAAHIGKWAKNAVALAARQGYIKGYLDGTFRPDEAITRAEMAKIVANAMGLTSPRGTSTGFSDDARLPAWAKSAIAAVREKNIMKGKPTGEFDPNAKATRAEAVTVLLKLLEGN